MEDRLRVDDACEDDTAALLAEEWGLGREHLVHEHAIRPPVDGHRIGLALWRSVEQCGLKA